MDTNNQVVPEPIMQQAQPEAKNKKYIAIIVVLVILAVGGFAFGGVGLWQNLQKDNKIKELSNQLEMNNSQAKENAHSYAENENKNENEDNAKSGHINIKIIANLDSVELEKCESGACLASGYAIGVADSDLYSYLLPNQIIFIRHDGLFSGTAFHDNIEKEFEFSGEIKQIIVGHFGNGGDEAILILRKDGTIGAIRLDDEYKNFIDIQIVDGVSDVNALYQGYMDNGEQVFAVHSDGSFDILYDKIWGK